MLTLGSRYAKEFAWKKMERSQGGDEVEGDDCKDEQEEMKLC